MIEIRKYADGEERRLWEIYFGAIRYVCIRDYTEDQVRVWAPDEFDQERWQKRMKGINPYVVVVENEIAGYADLQDDGYIDHFFIHYQYQRRGLGNKLMDAIIADAQSNSIRKLYSHVSKTAKGFYLAKGFRVVKNNIVNIRGVDLANFTMEREME